MASGGKAGGGTGSHDYYGTIAGLVCAGPVDAVLGIISDSKTVWPEASSGEWTTGTAYDSGDMVYRGARAWVCNDDHTASELLAPGVATAPWDEYALRRTDAGVTNPVPISVPGYGVCLLYWGTDTQTHSGATPAGISSEHPPYRRQCWVVLKDWLFGRERTSAPNVEILVRRAPAQSIVTGPPALLDVQGQANPIAFAAELLTDPVFGAGAPDLVDVPSWQSTAEALQADSGVWNISPVIREAKSFQEVLETVGNYAPVVQRSTGEGKMELRILPRFTEPPVVGPSVTLDEVSLAGPISWEVGGVPVSDVSVRYSDRGRAFKSRAQRAVDTLSRGDGSGEVVNLDRPWITRADQASFAAADHLRRKSQAPASGRAQVLRDRVPWLVPGVPFMVDDPRTGIRLLCRCLSISDASPPSGLRTVTFESEDAYSPTLVLDSSGGIVDESQPAPETVTLLRLVQPPSALTGEDSSVAALVARTSPVTTAVRVWLRETDASLFTDLGIQRGFAIAGSLQATYSATPGAGNPPDDDSEALRVTVNASTVPADLSLLSQTQSADAISDARVLVWVFKASGQFEICTLKSARVATGESFWRLKVRRARFGTTKLSFSSGDQVYVLRRESLEPYTHRLFGAYSVTGTPATFRLQASNIWRTADLSDPAQCPDRSFTFGDSFAPSATWTRIEYRPPAGSFADVSAFGTDYDPAGTWRISWTCSDPNSDLSSCGLRSVGPQATSALLFSGVAAGASASFVHEFTIPEGDWDMVLRVIDRAGRARHVALSPVGGGSPVVIRSRPTSPTIVANPVAVPRGGDVFGSVSVALTCSTAASTIQYQVVALGAAAGGSWTTYAAPVSVSPDHTLYARATASGLTTSPTVRHDYSWLDPESVS